MSPLLAVKGQESKPGEERNVVMGCPLFVAEEVEAARCSCCEHPFCEESRRTHWCGHWFRIKLIFDRPIQLHVLLKAFQLELEGHDFAFRMERLKVSTQRTAVLLWLCIDPYVGCVSLSWIRDLVSSVFSFDHLGEMDELVEPFHRMTEFLHFPCCIIRLLERLKDDCILQDITYQSPDLCYSDDFLKELNRFYEKGSVFKAVLSYASAVEDMVTHSNIS